jgi:hypothetical protein
MGPLLNVFGLNFVDLNFVDLARQVHQINEWNDK